MNNSFDYDLAFSRNIGWFSEDEQQILKTKRVAIAGLGGVGGSHLLTLTRLGITKFHLSDFDQFACENSNRQAGANIHTYDQNKLDIMVDMALSINPELDIKVFPEGINNENMDEFLTDVDCYVDSLDFFALEARKQVFALCYEKGIPATTAAPIGMGTAYLNFMPGKMTFEQYFGLNGYTENEQYLKFFLGLTPAALQRPYLVDPSKLDLAAKKGPSTIAGCQLAAGVAVAQVAKIFLNRGKIVSAPWGLHFDAFTNQYKKTWRPWGHKNPIQRLAFALGKKILLTNTNPPEEVIDKEPTLVEQVLNYARWAPSGDNSQCWRFEITDQNSFVIHMSTTQDSVVYDLDGHSSHLAHGILLKTIEIAATKFKTKALITQDCIDDKDIRFSVVLEGDDNISQHPLVPYIRSRAVQRRSMGTKKLSQQEKAELELALPEGYSIQWFESFWDKWEIAKLNFCNAKTRLTMKEAFEVHKNIIEWKAQFSETKIPEHALGVDWPTARLMQWMFESWNRVQFANKYFAGTVLPRIQLDVIPSLRSCAHFAVVADSEIKTTADYIEAGKGIQNLWLTCTKLGLGFQPEQTPVIFSRYLTAGRKFTADSDVIKNAEKGKHLFDAIVNNANNTVFLGRIGRSQLPKSRSVRLPLDKLMAEE